MNKRYEEGRKPGSPPRGRGKVIAQRHALFGVGITPAWAGKSQSSFRAVLLHGDHPRVGGEKGSYRWVIKSVKGSPPHGRGKVFLTDLVRVVVRITPAQAGKSRRCCLPGSPRRDHPRVGGEKHQDESSVMELQGSPPRGRGKGPHHKYCHPFHRITPAWAGKSGTNNRPGGCTGDHPRVGGEKGRDRRTRLS